MNVLVLQEQQVLLISSQPNPITISTILELGTMAHTYNLSPYHRYFMAGHLYGSSNGELGSISEAWLEQL